MIFIGKSCLLNVCHDKAVKFGDFLGKAQIPDVVMRRQQFGVLSLNCLRRTDLPKMCVCDYLKTQVL